MSITHLFFRELQLSIVLSSGLLVHTHRYVLLDCTYFYVYYKHPYNDDMYISINISLYHIYPSIYLMYPIYLSYLFMISIISIYQSIYLSNLSYQSYLSYLSVCLTIYLSINHIYLSYLSIHLSIISFYLSYLSIISNYQRRVGIDAVYGWEMTLLEPTNYWSRL